jgi:hypothetical protein
LPVGHAAVRRGALLLALTVALAGTATPLLAASPSHASRAGGATGAEPSSGAGAGAPRTGRFTIDTNLLSSSGLSAWAIDRFLGANTPLPPLGSAFKAAERKYGVNARYLLAHAMLETAFGTSYFALNHRNLFGWTAFDRDPGKYASRFPSYDHGIDYVARRIHDWYLVPSGRFYGGAPTLRGMHMYASDPRWEEGIARIANLMAIPTLAGREFEMGRPQTRDTVIAGRKVTVRVDIDVADGGGPLPDGLRIAARWRPIAIIETSTPARTPPPARPDFELISGRTTGGKVLASVVAPKVPGRYRLELQIRDSDGTPLSDGSRLAIPGVSLRVHATDAVAYDLEQTDDGLSITIRNIGRKAIAAVGTGKSAATLTSVAVWSLPRRGSPALLTRVPLAADLAAGEQWTSVIPTEVLEGAFPGMLLFRLEIAGSPRRLLTSPPGVFQVDLVPTAEPGASPQPDPTATPTPQPDPTSTPLAPAPPSQPAPTAPAEASPSIGASSPPSVAVTPAPSPAESSPPPGPTPSAPGLSASTAGTSSGSTPAANPPATTRHVSASADAPEDEPFVLPPLKIRAVTPGDPASATLLKGASTAAASARARAKAAAGKVPKSARANVTASTTAVSTSEKEVRAVRYEPFVGIADGRGSVLLTNTGTVIYHREAPDGVTSDGSKPAVTALVVTAIPATGGLDAALVLRFPLKVDLAPGEQVEVPIRLPALPGVQPSFLVSARLVTAEREEQPTSAATVFWMRGAPAAPRPVVVSKPVLPAKPAAAAPAPPAGVGSEAHPTTDQP